MASRIQKSRIPIDDGQDFETLLSRLKDQPISHEGTKSFKILMIL